MAANGDESLPTSVGQVAIEVGAPDPTVAAAGSAERWKTTARAPAPQRVPVDTRDRGRFGQGEQVLRRYGSGGEGHSVADTSRRPAPPAEPVLNSAVRTCTDRHRTQP